MQVAHEAIGAVNRCVIWMGAGNLATVYWVGTRYSTCLLILNSLETPQVRGINPVTLRSHQLNRWKRPAATAMDFLTRFRTLYLIPSTNDDEVEELEEGTGVHRRVASYLFRECVPIPSTSQCKGPGRDAPAKI